MLQILTILVPIFALIGLGFAAARSGTLSQRGVDGLLYFVTRFAAPCLVMRTVLAVPLGEAFDLGLLAAYYLPVLAIFLAAFLLARGIWQRSPGEGVAIAFSTTFGNTVMLGIPVALAAFGDAAMSAIVGIVGLHGAVLYVLGITLMEALRRDGVGLVAGLGRMARAVAGNALLIGIALGAAGNLLGLAPLPRMLDQTTLFLAEGAVPAGLFAVGAALPRYRMRAEIGIAGMACLFQLLVQPAATWALATWVFGLDPLLTGVATVIAAMPLGMNGYIFAAFYGKGEGSAASGIVLSNPLSVATLGFWLLLVSPP